MDLVDQLAEPQIQRAIERGELSNLPGAGKPLPPEDLSMVSEHLGAGYRLLESAGFLPPEPKALRKLKDVEALLARAEDPAERRQHRRRPGRMETHPSERRGHALRAAVQRQYTNRLSEVMNERSRKTD